jgi:hypothetical protein
VRSVNWLQEHYPNPATSNLSETSRSDTGIFTPSLFGRYIRRDFRHRQRANAATRALRLVHSEEDLVKFSSLFHYEVAPEPSRCFSAGRSLLKGLNLPKTEASLLDPGDEFQLFQRGWVITSAATYAFRWRLDADLFVVAQGR